jgi:signal transduction histidine kinase
MMQGQIELAMAKDRNPEDDAQVLETLHVDVNRLTRISTTLLSLARNDSDEIGLELEPVELDALLDLVAEQYQPHAESSGVTLAVDADQVRILGDEDRLIQLLVNLVDNAFQHTPPGRKISLRSALEGDMAAISVIDEGRGIAPEHLPYIFERFYRTDSSRRMSSNGAGLGLSISKMIVEAHGGTIDVESDAGTGTRVTVRIPRDGPASG